MKKIFIDGNGNKKDGFQNNKTIELAKTRMVMWKICVQATQASENIV